jgi:hypothetical protein
VREVEVSRFVQAPPAAVERALSPARIVEYEGSFEVVESEETDDGWRVTGLTESPVKGPQGNIEFLITAVHDAGA